MPGPHFNSKRLKAARNVRAEFAPGSVPRVGTRLFTLRLLPRTVEKNCGCHIPKPKAPAFMVKSGRVQFNTQIIDPLDTFGDGTTVSWIHSSGIQVGDKVSFINPSDNQLFTTTVSSFITRGDNNRNYLIILTDPHGNGGQIAGVDINLHI